MQHISPYVIMVMSKQLNNKLKSTPKMSLRNREVSRHVQSTPHSSTTNFNDEEFLEIVKEEIENREEKFGKIIKAQVENTNSGLDRISQEVVDITKSLKFMQELLDEELAKLKNGIDIEFYSSRYKIDRAKSFRHQVCYGKTNRARS